MTPEQARQAIKEALGQIAPEADLDKLAPDADLRDTLELDSLDFLNFVEVLCKLAGRVSTKMTTRTWPPWPGAGSSLLGASTGLPAREDPAQATDLARAVSPSAIRQVPTFRPIIVAG